MSQENEIKEVIEETEEVVEEISADEKVEVSESEKIAETETKSDSVNELEKKHKQTLSQLTRLQADFENYKKRTQKEKEGIYRYAVEEFGEKLLPVIDNLDRALESFEKDGCESDGYLDGVRMVFNQLLDVLKEEGIEEIKAIGEEFNPMYHHAVCMEAVDGEQDDVIIEVFQKGYQIKDKVLRPAMVKVCKN
jgi:molecular chaperone GrpE